MTIKTVRPAPPPEDLSKLTDRQLMERMYRELRAEIGGLFELAENHAVAIGRVEQAHNATAGRVDALISDRRKLDTEVKQTKTELSLARNRVVELERDVESFKRARTAGTRR